MFRISRFSCSAVAAVLCLLAFSGGPALADNTAATEGVQFEFAKTASLVREMATRPDFPVAVALADNYVSTLLTLGDSVRPAQRVAIIRFLKSAQQKNGGFAAGGSDRNASLLYTDFALKTLGELGALKAVDVGKVKSFVASLKNSDGGFGFSRSSKGSTLPTTYYAVRILRTLGDLDLINREKTVAYVRGFGKKGGGFGFVHTAGLASPRNTFMALYVLKTLGALDETTREKAVKFLTAIPSLNGKTHQMPDLDELFYAVESLKRLSAADRIDRDLAVAFLRRLYIPVNGGFGPLPGYGSAPGSTVTAVRILAAIGVVRTPTKLAAK